MLKVCHSNERYKPFLKNWIASYIKARSWEYFDDLHLDEIDSELIHKSNWVSESFKIHDTIVELIENSNVECILAIPLVYAQKETDAKTLFWKDINSLLDNTPPSYYLFPKADKNFEATIKNSKQLLKLSAESFKTVLFQESQQSEKEFARTVFVINRIP